MCNFKKLNRITVLAILIIAIAGFLISGCSAEESTWTAAVEAGTIEGYQEYLDNYPEGKYVNEARDSMAWVKASNEDTIESYDQYLTRYPSGEYASKALELIEGRLIPGTLKLVIVDKATGEPLELGRYTFIIATKGSPDDLTRFEKEARENNEVKWDINSPGNITISNILPGEHSLYYMTDSLSNLDTVVGGIIINPGQTVDLGVVEIEVDQD